MNLDNQNLNQVSQELLTIRDYIRWAYSRFNAAGLYYGHGTDNAWDEAVYLVLSALHLPPDLSHELYDSTLTTIERRTLCELIFRRINERIPAAYLTKEAWFAGIPFYVDKRVIIPRSPLAELIESEFSPWLDGKDIHHILDLCTGSGCIAVASAFAFPHSSIDAVDISSSALEVALINVKKHGLQRRINLIQSDLFDKITEEYDLIISNPPYVASQDYDYLPQEYAHEPKISLEANENGLALVIEILKRSAIHLTPDGILVVEVGNAQEALEEKYPEVPFLWLDLERGGEGIFLLTAEQVKEYHYLFAEL